MLWKVPPILEGRSKHPDILGPGPNRREPLRSPSAEMSLFSKSGNVGPGGFAWAMKLVRGHQSLPSQIALTTADKC